MRSSSYKPNEPEQGFPTAALLILGGRSVHCRTLSSILGPNPRDIGLYLLKQKNVSALPNVLWGTKITPHLRTTTYGDRR